MSNTYIKSPINYIGNKYKLLPQIIPLFPDKINMFVDLFGGSGSVVLNTKAEHYIYNDINNYVADIFKGIADEDVKDILDNIDYGIRTYELSKTNKIGFERLREDYNNGMNNWKTLYTMMCYSFNYQFRFNSEHKYNNSFGKDRSCFSNEQRKNLVMTNEKLRNMDLVVTTKRFQDFDFSDFDKDDFIYLDPPYNGSIGNYQDGKRGFEGWTIEHEQQLRNLLIHLDNNNIRFAMSNNIKVNEGLDSFAIQNNFKIHKLVCSYKNSNYGKKDKTEDDIEVLITNY